MIFMKHTITNEEKQDLIRRYHAGESATGICLQASVPRSTFYTWLRARRRISTEAPHSVSIAEHTKLRNRIHRLEQMVEVLKTVQCTATSPLKEKLTELEKLHGQYSVHLICEALDVARGTFYNHIFRNKRENNSYQFRRTQLSEHIRQVYDESNQIFGAKKIRAILSERGIMASDKMVAELMGEMNIGSIRTNSKKNYKRLNPRKKDMLRLDFNAEAPNTIWVSDTTYFRLNGRVYYICVILDLYSRKVIAHKVSPKHSTHLISGTFKLAYSDRTPESGLIFHSDRGAQYTSHSFQKLLDSCCVKRSFSPSGSPQHNAVMEAFFSSMKREELYRTNYRSVQEFKDRIVWYVDFYNTKRPHTSLKFKSPSAYECLYFERMGGAES